MVHGSGKFLFSAKESLRPLTLFLLETVDGDVMPVPLAAITTR